MDDTNNIIVTPQIPEPIKRDWLPWIIGGSLFTLVIIVFVGIIVGISILNSSLKYNSPSPTAPVSPEITIVPLAKKFATDAGVLKLRDDLKVIRQAIDSVDLVEPQINTPALDLNISIKYNPQ